MRAELADIARQIAESQQIAILTHVSLDGDCLGSSIALGLELRRLGKAVYVLTDAPIPGALRFLPGKDLVIQALPDGFTYDMAIALDCGDKERFQDRKKHFALARVTANIDHHGTNAGYAQLNCVDKHSSSTAELVFELLKGMGAAITTDIAVCLYVGLVTDTGGFKYGNTNEATHICAAELLGYGLNIATLSQDIFVYETESMLRLKARALSSLRLEYDKRLAIVSVSMKDFADCQAEKSETEGFADFGRALPSVFASVALREFEQDKIKISMRSKGAYDVSRIAQKFNGGGHINAAGCSIDDTLENAIARIIAAFEELKTYETSE
ncbi:MAG: bifunctional oligoribonuclease/PAP phosphatase NrnA [Clostridia bacterium]